MSTKQQRIDGIRERILSVVEKNLAIAAAAARAAELASSEEAAADMTMEEQRIALDAMLPPKEAPMYLHGTYAILKAGVKAAVGEEEQGSKAPVFNIVLPAANVEAWRAMNRPKTIDAVAVEKKDDDDSSR